MPSDNMGEANQGETTAAAPSTAPPTAPLTAPPEASTEQPTNRDEPTVIAEDAPDAGETSGGETSGEATAAAPSTALPSTAPLTAPPEASTERPSDRDEPTFVTPGVQGEIYLAIAARRTAFDSLMWQVPAIGLTAQAFLLTIALGADSSRWARGVAASLALFTALVAIQTMAKHQVNERTDSRILQQLDETYGVRIGGVSPHVRPVVRGQAVGNKFRGWIHLRSFDLWIASLTLFALAASVIIILTVFKPDWLN